MAHDPGMKRGTMKAFSTDVVSVSEPAPRFDESMFGSPPQPATSTLVTKPAAATRRRETVSVFI
ncbi:putative uncharacterized protein [Mycolicibacterium novocastrense]|uniref:Uncharacterized protein n=1 Tax=Mycolicibacterium novocastrense TaxID=59813 RepID=A0ABQ0KJR2_MYCNV|nr:putative uncharacterized protein [Mycolicibacterium novocastrense]